LALIRIEAGRDFLHNATALTGVETALKFLVLFLYPRLSFLDLESDFLQFGLLELLEGN
jgi:hypothetical protein